MSGIQGFITEDTIDAKISYWFKASLKRKEIFKMRPKQTKFYQITWANL